MTTQPVPADPEIASAMFHRHLDDLWATGRPKEQGWGLIKLSELEVVVTLPAKRLDGTRDWYFLKLGAQYYDLSPPTVAFVNPVDWSPAAQGTRWFPVISPNPPWFGLHHETGFPDGTKRQLVCFSFTAEYYMTNHSPTPEIAWQKGRHTVAATLNRLAEVLLPLYYQRPSA